MQANDFDVPDFNIPTTSGLTVPRNYRQDCSILIGDEFEFILGKDSGVAPKAIVSVAPNTDPFRGFSIDFPYDDRQALSEEAGRGIRYRAVHNKVNFSAEQSKCHRLVVRFPRDGTATTFEEAGEDFMARFPTAPKSPHTIISVQMNDGAQVEVDGFGLQFSNPAEPVMEGWLNRNEPIFPGVTLQTFLDSGRFHLLVPESVPSAQAAYGDNMISPAFSYPYGTEHAYDLSRYGPLLEATKSRHRFLAALNFRDDNSLVAVVTQTIVQDIFWVHEAANKMRKQIHPAYFVPITPGTGFFYVIVFSRGVHFNDAWRRLTGNGRPFAVDLHTRVDAMAHGRSGH